MAQTQAEAYVKAFPQASPSNQYIGIYQGKYYQTNPQGGFDSASARAYSLSELQGWGLSGQSKSDIESLSSGLSPGEYASRAEQQRIASDEAAVQARNRAYEAAARGDFSALGEVGVSRERFAQIQVSAPKYTPSGKYIAGTGVSVGPQPATFDVSKSGQYTVSGTTQSGKEAIARGASMSDIMALTRSGDIRVADLGVVPGGNPALISPYNAAAASMGVLAGIPSAPHRETITENLLMGGAGSQTMGGSSFNFTEPQRSEFLRAARSAASSELGAQLTGAALPNLTERQFESSSAYRDYNAALNAIGAGNIESPAVGGFLRSYLGYKGMARQYFGASISNLVGGNTTLGGNDVEATVIPKSSQNQTQYSPTGLFVNGVPSLISQSTPPALQRQAPDIMDIPAPRMYPSAEAARPLMQAATDIENTIGLSRIRDYPGTGFVGDFTRNTYASTIGGVIRAPVVIGASIANIPTKISEAVQNPSRVPGEAASSVGGAIEVIANPYNWPMLAVGVADIVSTGGLSTPKSSPTSMPFGEIAERGGVRYSRPTYAQADILAELRLEGSPKKIYVVESTPIERGVSKPSSLTVFSGGGGSEITRFRSSTPSGTEVGVLQAANKKAFVPIEVEPGVSFSTEQFFA